MSPIKKAEYIKPEEVKPDEAQKIMAILNSASSADELANVIDIPGERDIGTKLAQRILEKRKELGGFKGMKQVAAVSQIGPERFSEIVMCLSRKEIQDHQKYTIEGQIKGSKAMDFRQNKLTVCAFVNDVEMAKSNVDEEGRYTLSFKHKQTPSATELRVVPQKCASRSAKTLSVTKTMSPMRFKKNGLGLQAIYDIVLPSDILVLWGTITKTYQMHGAVYATTFSGGMPISIEPLPAVKMEFFEMDTPPFWIYGTDPVLSESYLGYAYTGPDGSYDFEFDFSYTKNPMIWPWYITDTKPDIQVRISQFIDGLWQQIYEGSVDWDIVEDFHRDFFIPVEDVLPIPEGGIKPEEGFRFDSVGLLPIDETRIQQGYATAQTGDPTRIAGISHQPFCGTLRIFGLFGESIPVTHYKVQIAEADEDEATGSWQDLTDSLSNRKWNDALHQWDSQNLGPDPATGMYQNIDTEPEADWHEHALKITWNTANYPNGYYALRIIGYDSSDAETGTFEMPIVRIDNSIPDADLEVVGTTLGGVTDCGALQLNAIHRDIEFLVTAHDSEGHVLKYWLNGERGKDDLSAGSTITVNRPDASDNWNGTSASGDTLNFTVDGRPASLAACPALAYSFELHVWGLATDGYDVTPNSQRVEKEVNLVVSE